MPAYILKEYRTHWKVPSCILIHLKENWHDLINDLLDYPVMHLVIRVTANVYVTKVVQKQHSFTERHLILKQWTTFIPALVLWWRHVHLCFIEVWWLMMSPHTDIFNNWVSDLWLLHWAHTFLANEIKAINSTLSEEYVDFLIFVLICVIE